MPANGDTVVLSNDVADVEIVNDIPGLSIAALQVTGGVSPTVRGEPLVITGSAGVGVSKKTCIYNDLTFTCAQTLNTLGELHFYGSVVVTNAAGTRCTLGTKGGTPTANVHFYGPVLCGKLGGWQNTFVFHKAVDFTTAVCGVENTFGLQFYSPGNRYEDVKVNHYGGVTCFCADAMPTNAVLRFGNQSMYNGDNDNRATYALNYDQTIDRIESEDPLNASGEFRNEQHVRSTKGQNPVITMRGTADATSYAQWQDDVSFVWDPVGDFTQTFVDRNQLMSGSVTVKGGTFRSAGTNAFLNVPEVVVTGGAFEIADPATAALPALQRLKLSGAGVFRLASDVTVMPFPANQVEATIRGDAKIALSGGQAIGFRTLMVDGVLPPAGTYTGVGHGSDGIAEATWIDGAGQVTVVNADVTSWKAPVDGDWSDADNWTGGVPTTGVRAFVTAEGADYTVTFDRTAAYEGELTVDNFANRTTVEIPSGVSVTLTGLVTVGGEGSEGTVTLKNSGGTFLYVPRTKTEQMKLKKNAAIKQTSGSCAFEYVSTAASVFIEPFRNEGGKVLVTGGTFGPVAKGTTHAERSQMTLSGDWAFTNSTYDVTCLSPFTQLNAGDSGEVTFGTGSSISAQFGGSFFVGNKGFTRLNIHEQIYPPNYEAYMGWKARWGYDGGIAEINITNSMVTLEACGTQIGTMETDGGESSATGVVNVVNGGTLRVWGQGANQTGWSGGYLQGVLVGYGALKDATKGDRPYYGELNVGKGGYVDNWYGDFCMGTGYARGVLDVDGGQVRVCNYSSSEKAYFRTFGVGLFGGEGRCVVKNGGDLYVRCFTRVGGAAKADFPSQGNSVKSRGAGLAEGTITVADGTAVFYRGIVLGADGYGTFEVVGSAGSVKAGSAGEKGLVMSNLVDCATSGSKLRFVADTDGVKTLQLEGPLVVGGNATLEVDMSAYAGRKSRVKLLTCTGREGVDFANVSVTWQPDTTGAGIQWVGNDLYAVRDGLGMLLIVR